MRCQRQMVDSRRIGAIIGRLIAGITARSVDRYRRRIAFESHLDRRRNGTIIIQFVQIDSVVEAYTVQY